jgi:predicted nucleic acid-binding protein
MIYFDTDVWINSFVTQNKTKHEESNRLIGQASKEQNCVISTLIIQETLFVLGRLKMPHAEIAVVLKDLIDLVPINYGVKEIERASIFVNRIGFRHINDCLHIAIAETCCSEIITYNKKDFNKLQTLTKIKVTIL